MDLTSMQKPKVVCPLMSTTALLMVEAPGMIKGTNAMPTIIPAEVPCIGQRCGIWNGVDNICGLSLSFSLNEIRISLEPSLGKEPAPKGFTPTRILLEILNELKALPKGKKV